MYIKAIKSNKSFFQKYNKGQYPKTQISNPPDGGRVEPAYQTTQIFW